uniref:ATP synthase complex subunit 8 n=1 Tax=Epicalotermes sp. 1 AB-2022a TaxID=2942713 RepID=A0A8X8M2Z7_9NEOP|nr:ATP synthase F0 subunit 8 [Epicalotermes sp. 1 AB-2022a]
MPQMMPMSWMSLFTVFSMTLILFSATNYFSSTLSPKYTMKSIITSKTMNWKW